MSLLNPLVSSARNLTQDTLISVVNSPQGTEILPTAFGDLFDFDLATTWLQTEVDSNFGNFPDLEIRPTREINYADGAYAADNNTIYLSTELIAQNDPETISNVILEEYGHFLDARFSPVDSPGDEGELFANYFQGKRLTDLELTAIRQENDRTTVAIDDRQLTIEQANPGDNLAFDLIGLTQLRNDPQFAGIDGSGFSVAIIDTGIDFNHPLIAPNYLAGFDFIDNDPDPTDSEGHGTHLSGIVGAADETIGVAPDAGLIGLRTLDNDGAGFVTEIEDALEWVLENRDEYNITAVNLSFGTGFFASESELQGSIISDDIQRLEAAGVTVISAAGNNYFANSGRPNQANLPFPAISSTIAVGAVWQDGTKPSASWQQGSTDFSTGADRIVSFSQRLDADNVIFAPGAIINSTVPGGGIGENAGTSQASPHVAGAVALIQEASLQFSGRLLTPEEINEILRTTADPIIDGDDEDVNVESTGETYFRINIYAAISEVKRRSENIDSPIDPPSVNNPDTNVSEDSNGTIAGAFVGPTLDGSPINPIRESIGRDGANIRDNDVDIYSFKLVSPGTVGIELTSDLTNPEDFDSYLQLFDAAGNAIAVNNNIAPDNLFSRIEANLEPGTYYVGVSDFNNRNYNPNNLNNRPESDGGSYELIAQLVNDDINGSITQVDRVTTLPIINRVEVIGRDEEQVVGDRDVDFYRLNSGQEGILEIAVNSQVTDPLNSVILLFDGEGKRLGISDRTNSDDSLLRFQITPNTDYYVGITGFGNQNFDPFALGSGTGGDTGTYAINGSLKPLSEGVNLVDDTIASPALQDVAVGETLFANIGNDSGFIIGDTDVDLYRFVPQSSELVTIQTITSEEFSADTYLRIFDANGNEIAANNDKSPLNQGSLIQFEAIASAEYYLGVNGNSVAGRTYSPLTGEGTVSGSSGNYNLNISNGNNISGTTVYRFFRPEAGVHFYTASETERDTIINNLPNYTFEGASFESVSEAADPLTGAKPVYRFFNSATGAHLYTISEAERNSIEANLPNFSLEGIAYYGFEQEQPGSTPLYRFYNPNLRVHFYTPSAVERDAVLTNLPDYQLESDDGIAFYVDPLTEI